MGISIHSSHTGRDTRPGGYEGKKEISIHSSHTGRDAVVKFLIGCRHNFNPLFPYGKRPDTGSFQMHTSISIHSSHTGRDGSCRSCPLFKGQFQSTLPIREETSWEIRFLPEAEISIHSSHTGRDGNCNGYAENRPDFNPLFPYGKRRTPSDGCCDLRRFQSTLPIREETWPTCSASGCRIFQSTLPIREETGRQGQSGGLHADFNPLFPYGKRPPAWRVSRRPADFNPLFPYGKRRY